ncbi:3-hydroxyacyl-CoA dehydrogenase NAD-binding domain-containing protein [Pollutimonas bauzanensis]|uniref:Short chain enoyl-CoA hydratase n=1 Tax=Pollutimonas bauzanensis TaxID=658167 RepID=A0A1M5SDS2_9BURK|nr:3-hydroxyacyl-CoA dehydrogenase NAD-binding domain-containing protein [Pollutimonas bauzanensis]SHH36619.1 short chain enoyl-CoA hydratase [Pollutimonas bauzanensis]
MSIRLALRESIGILSADSPPVNALSRALRQQLSQALGQVMAAPGLRAVLLTSALPKVFSAGADIKEFSETGPAASPSLLDLVAQIEASPIPFVAVLQGAALGGGLELALACHFRLATADASLGLPEITLGLIPGAGGTQRLPRLVGSAHAQHMILSGAPVKARQAHSWGLVDTVLGENAMDDALAWTQRMLDSGVQPRRVSALAPAASGEANDPPLSRPPGSPLARQAAAECVGAAGLPFQQGLAIEQQWFKRLLNDPASQALRYAFFAERPPLSHPASAARPVLHAAVVGAGTMGRGIMLCLIESGVPALWYDAHPNALCAGIDAINSHYKTLIAKGRIADDAAQARIALIRPVAEISDLRETDIVIEAVFEDMPIKQSIFQALDACMHPGAVLATNTSTLDVDQIASATGRPESVVGLHFFSPANVMRLLEVVRGSRTSPDVMATALSLARRLRKTAIISGVCDGFIGNRMWHQYLRQAALMVERGALPYQVDEAMRNWGFAMGPFQVADLAGLDVGYSIRQRQYIDAPQRPWPAWLDRVSEAGRLGLKAAAGIYSYHEGSREPQRDASIEALIAATSVDSGVVRQHVGADEIATRCVHALIVEAARILEEKIALRASDIDAVFLSGYGFPRLRGGPCYAADALGLSNVVATLQRYAAEAEPDFWRPPALLEQLALRGEPLHRYSKQQEPL